MSRYDFWTHGVNIVAEHPDRLAFERRWGGGAEFEQVGDFPEGDERKINWFDLAIPSPSVLEDDKPVSLRNMRLSGHCNENAFIVFAAVHDGRIRQWETDLAPHDHDTGLTGDIDLSMGVEGGTMHRPVTVGINLCVKVRFDAGAPRGHVSFFGAGALYTA